MTRSYTFFSIICISTFVADGIDYDKCFTPLGMESGEIKDEDITASSSFDRINVGPQHGRIRNEKNGGAWCPKQPSTVDGFPREYIEIDLHKVVMVSGIETQGRFGNGQGLEYAEYFFIKYWRPKLGKWISYKTSNGNEMIEGNHNTYTEVKRRLNPPILASKLRIIPHSYFTTVCLRVEFYGCHWTGGIVSYSMPQGNNRSDDWVFYDVFYDGFWGEKLINGLGQLTDGEFAPDYFRPEVVNDSNKGDGWVGWNREVQENKPIEIIFEFDFIRKFNAVQIHSCNQFTKDVQVFSKIEIEFSLDGRTYSGKPVVYEYMEDKAFEKSRNVTVQLGNKSAQYVKLLLYFAARWIMISEIVFDSAVADRRAEQELVNTIASIDPGMIGEYAITIPTSSTEQPNFLVATLSDKTFWMYIMIIVVLLLTLVIVILAISCLAHKYFTQNLHSERRFSVSSSTAVSTILNNNRRNFLPGNSSTSNSFGSFHADGAATNSAFPANCHHMVQIQNAPPHLINTRSRLINSATGTARIQIDEYQQPYRALTYSPYYSYSTVVNGRPDQQLRRYPSHEISSDCEYSVPEVSNVPLLPSATTPPLPNRRPPSSCQRSNSANRPIQRASSQPEIATTNSQSTLIEIPRTRFRMISIISEHASGRIYVAEANKVPEFGGEYQFRKKLVCVKFINQDATVTEKIEFLNDIKIVSGLSNDNIARVLGVCTENDPYGVIMEYLETGDLNRFLKNHIPSGPSEESTTGTISSGCLLYIATQIANAMRYLESRGFVHRDLATRNCIIGKGFQVKVCDFGIHSDEYSEEYYEMDGKDVPLRWMAWESVFDKIYTSRSDVWAFGVTFWEILTMARMLPYQELTDVDVIENLSFIRDEGSLRLELPKPSNCSNDIYDIMRECWSKDNFDRPSFREIHLFLQRKNLGYIPAISA